MRKAVSRIVRACWVVVFLAALLAASLGAGRFVAENRFPLATKPAAGALEQRPAPLFKAGPTEDLLPAGAVRRRPLGGAPAARPRAAVKKTADSEIRQLQQRLQELGSRTQRLIEIHQGRRHRFVCDMPLGAGSNYARRFEDVDTDRVVVVRRVVAQVERWLAARGVSRAATKVYR